MTALSSLLVARPEDEDLQQAWVRAMLPLAGDPEQTCQVSRSVITRATFFGLYSVEAASHGRAVLD